MQQTVVYGLFWLLLATAAQNTTNGTDGPTVAATTATPQPTTPQPATPQPTTATANGSEPTTAADGLLLGLESPSGTVKWAVLLTVVGIGTAILVGVIVAMCCCCRRRDDFLSSSIKDRGGGGGQPEAGGDYFTLLSRMKTVKDAEAGAMPEDSPVPSKDQEDSTQKSRGSSLLQLDNTQMSRNDPVRQPQQQVATGKRLTKKKSVDYWAVSSAKMLRDMQKKERLPLVEINEAPFGYSLDKKEATAAAAAKGRIQLFPADDKEKTIPFEKRNEMVAQQEEAQKAERLDGAQESRSKMSRGKA